MNLNRLSNFDCRLYQIALFFAAFFFSVPLDAHPVKLTSSRIAYDAENNNIEVECRMYIDDFEFSINKTLPKPINVYNPSDQDKIAIAKYFEANYKVSINGKMLPVKFERSKIHMEENICQVTFSKNVIEIKKGDKLLIENKLFFKEFGNFQLNKIALMMPPLLPYDLVETTISTPSYTYTF